MKKIAIVGPGCMPIPCKAWGACESLVWDYYCNLKNLGYDVHIINTPNQNEIVQTIKNLKPDLVHIQYDDHACIVPYIAHLVKKIYITNHFAYLDQDNLWYSTGTPFHGWRRIFDYALHSSQVENVTLLVLSEKIKNIFIKYGVDPKKIQIQHNGAREDLFRFDEKCIYPNKSVCVAKIEDRKGQILTVHDQTVFYAGNKAIEFKSENCLGEWTKEYLYDNLTNYANLVLLSYGEADSLAIKESLMAGLGLVISEHAVANLDLSLPFISVIKMDKVHDQKYLSEIIEANRKIAITMKKEIRDYAIANFSWKNVTQKYISTF